MKIVNSDINFVLESVEKTNSSNSISIELNRNPFIPREFNKEEYVRCKLVIEGFERPNQTVDILKKYIGDFIDIEKTENGTLDFWSDGQQIGEFKYKDYQEEITKYQQSDWISEHQKLIEYYYNQTDQSTQDYIKWKKFVDNLEFNTIKEIENLKSKNQFFMAKNQQESIKANEKVIEFANRILTMINQYKKE